MNYEFIIPIIISTGLAIWNIFQQLKIENIKRDTQKQLHIHRIQFEKEFEIYKDLWSSLYDLNISISGLRPEMDSMPKGMTYEERTEQRIESAIKDGNEVINIFKRNKPFYSQEVYELTDLIIKELRKELFDVQYGERNKTEYWKEGKEFIENTQNRIENICEKIRDRIGNLKVI